MILIKLFCILSFFIFFVPVKADQVAQSEDGAVTQSVDEVKDTAVLSPSYAKEKDILDSKENNPEPVVEEQKKVVDQAPDNSLSEEFSSEVANKKVEGDGFVTSFLEDYSWFFEKKKTKHKLAVVPTFRVSRTYGTVASLRFFSYSPDKQGYYLGTSFSNQIFTSFLGWDLKYIDSHKPGFELHSYIYYNNFLDLYYGYGMDTKESDLKHLYAHKFYASHELRYLLQNRAFLSFMADLRIRKERPSLQEDKIIHPFEFLVYLKGRAGYDSRDSWRDAQKGQFHQTTVGCIPSLGQGSSFCLGEIDFRSYYVFLNRYLISMRGFAASSFFGQSSYSLNYTLGGRKVLRGFSENRFRGDKVYVVQTELKTPFPFWSKYLSGAFFFEFGEVAKHKEFFKGLQGLQWDFGGGLRVGIPPGYRMKLRIDIGVAPLDEEKKFNFIVDFFQAF